MNDPSKSCSRCGKELLRPITENANYVVNDDFAEEEPVEVYYALVHTDETEARVAELEEKTGRDFHALAAEMAHPDADDKRAVVVGTERDENEDGTFVETAKQERVEFSIPVEDFDREEVNSPDAINREDVAFVQAVEEQREVQKTGLVCRSCWKKGDDDIIWGADAE